MIPINIIKNTRLKAFDPVSEACNNLVDRDDYYWNIRERMLSVSNPLTWDVKLHASERYREQYE